MNGWDGLKSKRTTAGVMAAMMLFVVLFSVLFITVEMGHECEGHDCSVCACMQACEETLRQVCGGVAAIAIVALPFVFFLLFVSLPEIPFAWDTPVSKKIRLNN